MEKSSEKLPDSRQNRTKILIGMGQGILILAFGILIGALVTQKAFDSLPSLLPNLMAIFIAFFLLIILMILLLPRIFGWMVKRYSGKEIKLEQGLDEIQTKTNHVADLIASVGLSKAEPQIKQNIRHDLPIILNYLIFTRLRNVGLRFLIAVFIAIGGLMGTILLYNQNQLLTSQNELLNHQNEKIDNQILLDEASRRSSLNFLLANLLDKIDAELKETEKDSAPRRLSSQLIGRIASLSQSFRPYRFMDDGKMLNKAYSPERGNLLMALMNMDLDTLTLEAIFEEVTFEYSYLNNAIFQNNYLKGINLEGASLCHSHIRETNLSKAFLRETDFSSARFDDVNFTGSRLMSAILKNARHLRINFKNANLDEVNLSKSILLQVDFTEASLSGTNFDEAFCFITNFHNADLSFAKLTDVNFVSLSLDSAILFSADMKGATGLNQVNLNSCSSINSIKNLPDSLTIAFKNRITNDHTVFVLRGDYSNWQGYSEYDGYPGAQVRIIPDSLFEFLKDSIEILE